MSKWVETAMRPVPERSHMLKTWPTKAGPPPLTVELSPEILTVEGNAEEVLESDGGDGTPPLTAERPESKGELGGRRSGTHSLEVGWCSGGVGEGDFVLWEARRERRLEVVDWRKWEMGSVGKAMGLMYLLLVGLCDEALR
jgi:hypothetical protein